jgi:steroid delta-isomerase-like uncharacterized protein
MTVDDKERERRRGLLIAHLEAEGAGDLSKVLATFAKNAEMIYNHQVFSDHDHIRQAHAYMGFSREGAIAELGAVVERESFTDDEIVIEGKMVGVHRSEFQGFPGTNQPMELPFVTFYRFDADGKLASERVVMNLGPLGATPTWQPV